MLIDPQGRAGASQLVSVRELRACRLPLQLVKDSKLLLQHGRPAPKLLAAPPASTSAGLALSRPQDADAHLQHHFESIQDIADGTTLPSLLPALSRALAAAADVEAPLERLRCVHARRAHAC